MEKEQTKENGNARGKCKYLSIDRLAMYPFLLFCHT